MWQLNKQQVISLCAGFSAIALVMLFPPPGGGQTEWPVFVYSQHQVLTKLQPNGQPVVQYGWQSADLEDRVRLPIILICVLTAGGFVLSASPRVTDYPSDPSYRAIFRDPRAPRSRRR